MRYRSNNEQILSAVDKISATPSMPLKGTTESSCPDPCQRCQLVSLFCLHISHFQLRYVFLKQPLFLQPTIYYLLQLQLPLQFLVYLSVLFLLTFNITLYIFFVPTYWKQQAFGQVVEQLCIPLLLHLPLLLKTFCLGLFPLPVFGGRESAALLFPEVFSEACNIICSCKAVLQH